MIRAIAKITLSPICLGDYGYLFLVDPIAVKEAYTWYQIEGSGTLRLIEDISKETSLQRAITRAKTFYAARKTEFKIISRNPSR